MQAFTGIETEKLNPFYKLALGVKSYFNWLDENKIEISGDYLQLKETSFFCQSAYKWDNWQTHKMFLEKLLNSVIAECPKDEPLILISLGSGGLLIEYLLGKVLVQEGFNIQFRLVDPEYGDSLNREDLVLRLNHFIEAIRCVDERRFNSNTIKFFARAQDIFNDFTEGANVVVVETNPPHATLNSGYDQEKLICGSYQVPKETANSLAFFPDFVADVIKKSPGFPSHSCLPLYKLKMIRSCFDFDWGCKIAQDGSYSINFLGDRFILDFFKSINEIIVQTNHSNDSEEMYNLEAYVSFLKIGLEEIIRLEVSKFKNADKELSQEDIASILQEVEAFIREVLPKPTFFHLADYCIDRKETLSWLSLKAGYHYRKSFVLSGGQTTIKEI